MIEYNIDRYSDIELTDEDLNRYDKSSVRLYKKLNRPKKKAGKKKKKKVIKEDYVVSTSTHIPSLSSPITNSS